MRGAHVAQLTVREIVDLFEALGGVEGLAAEMAAMRMSAADLEKLRQLQLRIEQRHRAKDRLEYFHDNHELHETIVRFSGNSAIADIHARLIARVRRARYQAILSESRWNEAVQEHAHILAALENRDARRAGELMRQHVARTGEMVPGLDGRTAVSPSRNQRLICRRERSSRALAALLTFEHVLKFVRCCGATEFWGRGSGTFLVA